MNRWLSISTLAAAIVLFFGVNILASATLTRARLDLTQARLYTLSPGARAIAGSPAEPITLTLYYSGKTATRAGLGPLSTLAKRVEELLREYERASSGKVVVRVVDPEPFSEAEDRAVEAGLQSLGGQLGGESVFLGLVGTNSVDKQEVLPALVEQREPFLEYDISRMIHALADAPRRPVGLISWLPIDGMDANPLTGGRPVPAWQISSQLKELFDVKPLATNIGEIPADIGTLVVIHPKTVSDATQYALDQFVLRGGRMVLFVDPVCENDLPPGVPPMQAVQLPRSSSLPRLMRAWGVEMAEGKVAGDLRLGLSVNAGGGGAAAEPVTYVAWMRLGAEQRSSSDPLMGQLSEFILPSPGALSQAQGAGTDFIPLLFTTTSSSLIDAASVSMFPDPKRILADFRPGNTPLTLAARVTGPVATAFPDGPPGPVDGQEPVEPVKRAHLSQSAEPINVVVVADCDLLADRFWTQELSLGSVRLGQQKFSDNADLLIGAVDAFTGSSDLLSLRSRGTAARPFTRIDAMRKEAEQRFRAKEQELRERLRETELKIAEIQRARPDGRSMVILTPEQSAEIERFRADQVAIRTQLRDVQYDLRRDIEGMGTRIKAVNIAGVPVLVGVLAMGLAGYRAGRRRADRRSVGATN